MVFSNCGVDGRNLTLQFIVRRVPEVVSWAFSSSELRDREGGNENKQAELQDKRRHDFTTGNSRDICESNKKGRLMNEHAPLY